MELFAVFVFLLYASQESLTTTVEVYKGEESIVLPCLYSKELVDIVTVKWGRCGLNPDTVHQRREGDELHEQNQLFEGRTSMSPFALDTGDFSLTLREPQLSDSGIYSCSIIDDKQETVLSDIQLQVKEIFPTWAVVLLVLLVLLAVSGGLLFHFRHYLISVYKVEVDSGVESVLLPFKTTVSLPGGVTVTWRNNRNRVVDSYHLKELQLGHYKDRTEMKEKYKSGDFSLTLKNPTGRDRGIYTCTVYRKETILAEKQVLLKVKGEADSLIMAIDFGSGYSGYAFNLKPREEGGETKLKRWGKELGLDSPKSPTCILFDEDKRFLEFGYKAKTAYSNMRRGTAEKYYFFEDFKWDILFINYWSTRALEVFTEVLRFLKDDALKTIKHHPAGGEISASDFTWVLTVPHSLKDFTKRFMTEAAVLAGLVGEDTKDKLVFALESAAALAWCLKPPPDGFITQNHSRTSQDQPPEPAGAGTSCNDPAGGPEPGETRDLLENQNQDQVAVHFKKEPGGTKVLLETRNPDRKRYLVVDCGDQNVNITVHEVLEGGALKKLDNDVRRYLAEEKLKEFLGEIFSEEVWKEYEVFYPNEVQKMMFEFARLKHLDEDVQISCPDTLRKEAQREKDIETFFASVEGASWEDGVIKISRDKLRSFFDDILQRITEGIREILNKNSNIGFIVLVGGLAESQMLHQFITDQFGHQYKVLCPLRPQEAVLKGAVELGRNPELVQFD
ncbi:heat shock 70 kDa protein 12A-like [Fundulus heteroclitus]|uniref:heat shock 70 kDa protein 12A-like n=1 Tax=Fundulus heteroclitus TaxID=8078 RepID=UPI00165CB067|nr:heat shock 70 kDa protein 12A-like [Fundulus heteroclitus]